MLTCSANSACPSANKDWGLCGVIWNGQDVVTKLRSDQISFICTSPCHNKIISGRFTWQAGLDHTLIRQFFLTRASAEATVAWINCLLNSRNPDLCKNCYIYVWMKSCSIRLLKLIVGLFWVPTRPLGGPKLLKWWVFVTLCDHSVASFDDSPRKQEVPVSQAYMVESASNFTCVTRVSVRANLYTNHGSPTLLMGCWPDPYEIWSSASSEVGN